MVLLFVPTFPPISSFQCGIFDGGGKRGSRTNRIFSGILHLKSNISTHCGLGSRALLVWSDGLKVF
jgi:hypothetical protein